MNRALQESRVVPSEEVIAQRIKEFRQAMCERQAEAVVVYHTPWHPCPWPDCDLQILGAKFHLERMGDRSHYERLLRTFWLGPGIVGRCPSCHHHVQYDVEHKKAILEPLPRDAVLLPDDWHRIAYVKMTPQLETGWKG